LLHYVSEKSLLTFLRLLWLCQRHLFRSRGRRQRSCAPCLPQPH
jgi:hypothetical protein